LTEFTPLHSTVVL